MKKILHLTPLYFHERSCLGGGERYPLNLARGVVEASGGEYTADVISYDETPREQTIQPGVRLRLLPAVNQANPINVLSWELPAVIAEADLVHIHQAAMRASEVALLAAKQQRKPVCVTDHGSILSKCGAFPERLELADRVICYSNYGASLLRTATPIDIIKGGVDGRFFTPPFQPVKRDRVLYVGRLVPYKSVDQLILALPGDLRLTICGRSYHDDYFRKLQQLAKGKKVEFVRDADDKTVRELYRRAWANVLPTRNQDCYGRLQPAPELMGLTLLESMACGTPAICARVAAMPEFVRDRETGFVYNSQDELSARLRYLADNPQAVEQLGRRARQVIEQEFDYRVVGVRLLGVYERLLAQRMEAAA